MLPIEEHLKYKEASRSKDVKEIILVSTLLKWKLRKAISVYDKVDFRPKNISRIKLVIL